MAEDSGKLAAETRTARGRIVSGFCLGVTGVVVLALVAATFANTVQLLRTSTLGEPYPRPYYYLMPLRGTSPVAGAPGAPGADFSQVYHAANALRHGQSPYRPNTAQFSDRFGRPSGYPPLTNWLYVPLTLLPYHQALLAHVALSLLLFLGTTLFVLRRTGLMRHAGLVVLLLASLYLLTPIGLAHVERGQFDFLVATASLLGVTGWWMRRSRFGVALFAGLLGALKWTSVAFLGCFSAFGFLVGPRSWRWAFFLIPVVMALGTGLFWRGTLEYWHTIQVFELEATPYGLTLQHFLPRIWTKLTPILLTVSMAFLVAVRARSSAERTRAFTSVSLPFALSLSNVAVCFGTLSYEYHTVSTLGMVPALVVWTEKAPWVSNRVKAVTSVAFGIFLALVFRIYGLGHLLNRVALWGQTLPPPDERYSLPHLLMGVTMTGVYAGFALLFLGVAVHVLFSSTK
jgi:hypothetical protein